MCHKTHCFLFYNLNLYPTPQIVSIYCGLLVFISIFSRIFLICTVTVAISPTDSISQISRNNSSFVNTWFGFSAKKGKKIKFFCCKLFFLVRSPRHGVLSCQCVIPRISMISFFCLTASDQALISGEMCFHPRYQLTWR